MPQHAPQPTPTTNPPNGGQLALQREIDDLWLQLRSPKQTLFGARRIYARLAELRAELNSLENSDNDKALMA